MYLIFSTQFKGSEEVKNALGISKATSVMDFLHRLYVR
jgi:hypothetical protein